MALQIVEEILFSVFQKKEQKTLQEIFDKYAFDAKLPYQVVDSVSNEVTWADSFNFDQYITLQNSEKWNEGKGWMQPKKSITSFDDIMKFWKQINYVTTERIYDSEFVSLSDTIYRSSKVYHSTNCSDSSKLVFCNGLGNCESMLASSRSFQCTYCIRTDDSVNCTNSYNVICSSKISNSLFIQDCSDLDECMFCSHISNCRYCICNMQFQEQEYYVIKDSIVEWIINS